MQRRHGIAITDRNRKLVLLNNSLMVEFAEDAFSWHVHGTLVQRHFANNSKHPGLPIGFSLHTLRVAQLSYGKSVAKVDGGELVLSWMNNQKD